MSPLRFLFAIALVAGASLLSACGGDSDRSGESPRKIVEEATLQGIESGVLDFSLDFAAAGKGGGDVALSLSGPFQGEGSGNLPRLEMTAKASGDIGGEDVDFDGAVVLLPDRAYVNYEGVDYEIDPSTFTFVEPTLQPAPRQGGGSSCQEAIGELPVGDFVEGGRNEGNADVGGTETVKVSGELDVSAALDALLEVTESPVCKQQLVAAGPIPTKAEIEDAKKEVRQSARTARIDLYVGDDNIVRRVVAQLEAEPKNGGSGPKRGAFDLDLILTEVNEDQEIAIPIEVKPINDLLFKLGINPIELLGTLNGEGGGLLGLLPKLSGEALEGGGSGGGGSQGGANNQQSYLDCLRGAQSAADLQDCTQLIK